MILEASGLSFGYGAVPVLQGVDLAIGPGVTAVIGPNAAGKSTLLKCLCGQLTPRGRVRLDGRPLGGSEWKAVKRSVRYLPQGHAPRAVLTVFETVLLGRLDRLGWRVSRDDLCAVETLLDELGLAGLAGRYLNELSGGQAQMVAIAQALAGAPAVLLLDEPTSNLDLRRQFEICGLVRELAVSRGISAAIALHDLNVAARFADTVYVLQHGRMQCSGAPADVLTEEMIAAVYGVEVRSTLDEQGRPLITVLGPIARPHADGDAEL